MAQETITIEVGQPDNGKRLDKFLADKLRERFSRAFIQRLIVEGHVLVDGEPRKNHFLISEGQTVGIAMPAPRESDIMAEKIPLNIVYEDDDLLVVNKAPDMVVHPAPGNYSGTLVNALLAHCKDLSGIGGVAKPGIVHRLDKGTSGLLVVAKNDRAHRRLAKQFKAKTARRVYVALVKGVVQLDNDIIDIPIWRSSFDRKKMAVSLDEERGKSAVTTYHVVDRFKAATLVELTLSTGRTHQIRVHMSHIGHPVLGDVTYGGMAQGIGRPMLHARSIGFTHPRTQKFVEFTSDVPRDMKDAIKKARKA